MLGPQAQVRNVEGFRHWETCTAVSLGLGGPHGSARMNSWINCHLEYLCLNIQYKTAEEAFKFASYICVIHCWVSFVCSDTSSCVCLPPFKFECGDVVVVLLLCRSVYCIFHCGKFRQLFLYIRGSENVQLHSTRSQNGDKSVTSEQPFLSNQWLAKMTSHSYQVTDRLKRQAFFTKLVIG